MLILRTVEKLDYFHAFYVYTKCCCVQLLCTLVVYSFINPIQDEPFWGCSRMGGGLFGLPSSPDWFLYDNSLRHKRIKENLMLQFLWLEEFR